MSASTSEDGRVTASPLVRQINDGNWFEQGEAEALRAELYYQRAVHAYTTMLPALNVIGMRDGSEAAFGSGYNVLPVWKDRMDSRTWVPTPNADVIYSMSSGPRTPSGKPGKFSTSVVFISAPPAVTEPARTSGLKPARAAYTAAV